MATPERFLNALDRYVEAVIRDVVEKNSFTSVPRAAAKQTMINELRLLLLAAKEDNRTAAQKAAAWRK